jgi:hypothetical protein
VGSLIDAKDTEGFTAFNVNKQDDQGEVVNMLLTHKS